MDITFLYPKFLVLLFLIPFFVFVYFFSIIYNKKKAVMFANFEAMERFYDIEFFSKNFMALYMNLGVLLFLILALSGTSVSFIADTSAFSYVVAIDVSGSMSTDDVAPNRLTAAKIAAENFIDSLPVGVEVAVLEFAGDVSVLQALDSSKLKTKMALDSVDFSPVQGTNIYDAILASNKLFELRQMRSVILISDGQLNVGDAPRIVRYINRNNMIVNTIAVGTNEGGLTDLNTVSKIDEDFMKSLSFNSGGEFFRVESERDFSTSFNSIIDRADRKVTIDLSFYLLLAAVFLFSILWILYNLRFKVVP